MDKRLLFSAMLVAAVSANEAKAQTKVEDPAFPEPVQLKLDGSDTVFIKNVKAEQYLANSNAYKTQTSLVSEPTFGVAIVPNKDDDGKLIGYKLYDTYAGESFSKMIFYNESNADGGTSYVDYASQGLDKCNWEIFLKDGNTFEIQADTVTNKATTENTRAGWKANDLGSEGDGIFRPVLDMTAADASEYGVTWEAYPYEYIYRKNTLKEAINNAIDEGFDMSSIVAVYNNPNAKLWQLRVAYEQINVIKRNAAMENATASDPVDITEYVNDANCDALNGWTYECEFDANGNVGSGGHGTNWQVYSANHTSEDGTFTTDKFIERWIAANSNPSTNNASGTGHLSDGVLSQTLKSLPKGGYKLTCWAMATQQDLGDENKVTGVYLFADTKSNSKSATVATKAQKPQKFEFMLSVEEGEDLTIGFKLDNTTANWVFVDEFSLQYYGNDAKAMNLIDLQSLAAERESEVGDWNCYLGYVDQIGEIASRANELDVNSSDEEIAKCKEDLNAVYALAVKSHDAYAELSALNDELQSFLNDSEGADTKALEAIMADCGNGSSMDDLAVGDCTLDNDQLEAYMAKVKEAYGAAVRSGIVHRPGEPVRLVVNGDFSDGTTGWTGSVTHNSDYNNCEKYQGTFDLYQELTNLPAGVYTIKANAFQRVNNHATSSALHDSGEEEALMTAYIYGNDMKAKVSSPYVFGLDEAAVSGDYEYSLNGETKYIPNSMQAFAAACDAASEAGDYAYPSTVSVLVEEGGTLRFGIKEDARPEGQSADWTIWDDFQVIYEGTDNAAYAKVTGPLVERANALLDSKMTADSLSTLKDAIVAIQAAATPENISALSAAIEAANNSIAAYKPLNAAIENAKARYEANEAERTSSDAAKAIYNAAVADAENAYNNGAVADADVDKTIATLNEQMTKYIVNDLIEGASAENPKDVTKAIVNYDFSTMDATGWTAVEGTPGFQANNSVEAAEFYNTKYDFRQAIKGLPVGQYKLSVKAFYRMGADATAYADEAKTKLKFDTNDNAFLYYGRGYETGVEKFDSLAIKPISAATITESDFESMGLSDNSGLVAFGDTYVPNNMMRAQVFLTNDLTADKFNSDELTINYGGKADFVIGLTKLATETSDWTFIKSFKLLYLGQDLTGIEHVTDGASAGDVVGTKIYTVDGIEVSKLQKGINIVKSTLSDGTVKTSKVIVK